MDNQTASAILGTTVPFGENSELSQPEIFWREHQRWLLEHGYQLRPRYDPEWIPSWKRSKKQRAYCEDSIGGAPRVMDATRVSDGSFVAFKIVKKSRHPYEIEIARFFSSEPQASDPRNHCVPTIDVLQLPEDEDKVILVMPLLRRFDSPRFDTVGEGVEFLRQLLEGVHFMHANNVAHRDLMSLNIMMDASPLYPVPYHPRKPTFRRDNSGLVKHFTRTQCPVNYFIIDFGISRKYNPQIVNPLEEPIWGGDRTVPEFQNSTDPTNPFFTDIYYLGSFIREYFLQGSNFISPMTGFQFMKPLVDDMVQADPSKRPNMDEVVSRFNNLRCGLSTWNLRSRVTLKSDDALSGLFRAIGHWWRRIRFILWRVPALPVPKGKSTIKLAMSSDIRESLEPHNQPSVCERDLEGGLGQPDVDVTRSSLKS